MISIDVHKIHGFHVLIHLSCRLFAPGFLFFFCYLRLLDQSSIHQLPLGDTHNVCFLEDLLPLELTDVLDL